MKRTLYPLTSGVYTAIPATQFARLVELQEDDAAAAVGITLKFPEDGFTAVHTFAATHEPVILGDKVAHGAGRGYILGWPVQTGLNARPADNYVLASCVSGSTKLRVTEHD